MFSEKCFSYFSVFGSTENCGQIENIFDWSGKSYLIFIKWFLIFKTINHFSSLNFSFLHAFSLTIHSPLLSKVAKIHYYLSKFSLICRMPPKIIGSCHRMPPPKVAESHRLFLATIESHQPLPTFVDFSYKSKANNIF
jgi:hypothetical protein